MIKENYNFIVTNNPMLALEPGIAIILLVLAFNLVGNGLRDALNVKENYNKTNKIYWFTKTSSLRDNACRKQFL